VAIEEGLPDRFGVYPVRFYSWQTRTVRHHVKVTTFQDWLKSQLGIMDPAELTASRWLTIPQQHLLQVNEGAVFRDDSRQLEKARLALSWFPKDVWLWMMASQWHLIGNTQPLLGRAFEASDRRGESLIASRIVRLTMEMGFLQERRYWPYMKWFGTAFSQLDAAGTIGHFLDRALESTDHRAKEEGINQALWVLAANHNSLGLTAKVTPGIRDFEVGINNAIRPYPVINASDFVKACKESISDRDLRSVPTLGAIDQLTHGDDRLINFTSWPRLMEMLYRSQPEDAGKA
jgi:hypothetical protein